MEKRTELVSILLPIHNNEATLRESVTSLLSQTYQPLEIIAIDDFSRDGSFAILRDLRRLDKRIKVYRNVKHYGLTTTLNRCLKRSQGKFIAFMDPHDISSKTRIQKQVHFLLENDKTVAVGSQCMFFDEAKRKIGKSEFPQEHENIYNKLVNGISIQFETVLINTYLLPKDLMYFYKHEYPVIYTDLFLKMQKYGNFANLKDCLQTRIKQSSTTLETVKAQLFPHLLLFLKARFLHDYRPSVASLFSK